MIDIVDYCNEISMIQNVKISINDCCCTNNFYWYQEIVCVIKAIV